MLQKSNKVDYMTVKYYWVISLLNGLDKVHETVIDDMLFYWCEVNHVLNEGQMRFRKQRSVLDDVA